MSRTAIALVALLVFCCAASALAQKTNVVTRESTVTATVDRIETSSRVVTLRGDGNVFHSVYVEPGVKEFDTLKVGDRVTVRYVESAIVKVRPGAKPGPPEDVTEAARKAGRENVVSEVRQVVTIEDIDSDRQFVKYRTSDNMLETRAVVDKRTIEGLRPGDRVEVTFTRERAISIEHARR